MSRSTTDLVEAKAGKKLPKTLIVLRRTTLIAQPKHVALPGGLGSKPANPRYRRLLTRSDAPTAPVLSEDTVETIEMALANDVYLPRTAVVLEGETWERAKRWAGRQWGRLKGAGIGGAIGAGLGAAAGTALGGPLGTALGAKLGMGLGTLGGAIGAAKGGRAGAASAEHHQLKQALRRGEPHKVHAILRRIERRAPGASMFQYGKLKKRRD
jgi:hypothetical protein